MLPCLLILFKDHLLSDNEKESVYPDSVILTKQWNKTCNREREIPWTVLETTIDSLQKDPNDTLLVMGAGKVELYNIIVQRNSTLGSMV